MISSLPGCTPMKPGSASLPFFGVIPALLDDEGKELTGPANGHLVFKNAWPGMIIIVKIKNQNKRTNLATNHTFCYNFKKLNTKI